MTFKGAYLSVENIQEINALFATANADRFEETEVLRRRLTAIYPNTTLHYV